MCVGVWDVCMCVCGMCAVCGMIKCFCVWQDNVFLCVCVCVCVCVCMCMCVFDPALLNLHLPRSVFVCTCDVRACDV